MFSHILLIQWRVQLYDMKHYFVQLARGIKFNYCWIDYHIIHLFWKVQKVHVQCCDRLKSDLIAHACRILYKFKSHV